jgi:hypothetical protein
MSDRITELGEVHRFGDEHVEPRVERAVTVRRPRAPSAGDRGHAATCLLAAAHATDQLIAVFDGHADV